VLMNLYLPFKLLGIVAPINAAFSNIGQPYSEQCSAWTNLGNTESFQASDGVNQQIALTFDETTDNDILAISKLDDASNLAGVQVYVLNNDIWQKRGSFIDDLSTNTGTSIDDSSYSVALSSNGNKIAIADPLYQTTGRVRVYELTGTGWTQIGGDLTGVAENEKLGYSLDLSSDGNILATGDYRCNRNDAVSGCVDVYRFTETIGWTKEVVFTGSVGDNAGYSVSLSSDGNFIAFNAKGVLVYEYNTATRTWDPKGENLDPGENGDPSYLSLVKISSDGSIVAIKNEDNKKVFTSAFINGEWNQRGGDIDTPFTSNALDMSSDGNRLAIGADSVQVYTFDETGNWTKCSDTPPTTSGYPVVMSQDGKKIASGQNINGDEVVKVFKTGPNISLKDAWKLIPSNIPFTHDRFDVALYYDVSIERSEDEAKVKLMLKGCEDEMQNQSGFALDVGAQDGKLTVTSIIDDAIVISNKNIYKEPDSEGIAKIEFCVQTALESSSNVEVARRQANIVLSMDTAANFNITNFEVEAVEIDEHNAGVIRYDVTATIISKGSGPAPANKYQQGDIVTIEVEAKGGSVEIESIDSFLFQKTNDINCSQNITSGEEKELTIYEHSPDKSKCTFSTLLQACFFYDNGIVSGSGSATLKFKENRRRLEQEQHFHTNGYRQLDAQDAVDGNVHADISTWLEVGTVESTNEASGMTSSWKSWLTVLSGWVLLVWM